MTAPARATRAASEFDTKSVSPRWADTSRSTVLPAEAKTIAPSRTRPPLPAKTSVRSNPPSPNAPAHAPSTNQPSRTSTWGPCSTCTAAPSHRASQASGGHAGMPAQTSFMGVPLLRLMILAEYGNRHGPLQSHRSALVGCAGLVSGSPAR
jgi:hypothetical protein